MKTEVQVKKAKDQIKEINKHVRDALNQWANNPYFANYTLQNR